MENTEEKKVLEQLTEAVTEKTVSAVLEKIKADRPLRKQIFGDSEDRSEAKELAEKKEAGAEYLRKLARKEETKALSSGTTTSGSELVPTIVSDEIITVAQKYGLMRNKATHWPMQSINENIPTMSSVSAYRLNSDTSKVTSNQPTTGNIQLRAKTVGAIIPVSKVLLMNSTADLMTALNYSARKTNSRIFQIE